MRSPGSIARLTGVLYLLTVLTGLFAQGFVSARLVDFQDAAGTARNLVEHRGLFVLGFSVYLVEMACNVAITGLFYELLRPAGRTMSTVAACLSLAGCAVKTTARILFIAPLFILFGAPSLAVFNAPQLQALSLLLLRLNEQGAGIALAFFGFYGVLKGWLIYRSWFMPRALGVLSIVASAGWLTFLSPTLGLRAFPYVGGLGLIGAVAVIGWLLVKGVDEERWMQQRASAGAPMI